jgi:hypothetical protein
MQYRDMHHRLADRRGQMLGRAMIRRYRELPDRMARYPRETKPLRSLSQLWSLWRRVKSSLHSLLARPGQQLNQDAAGKVA